MRTSSLLPLLVLLLFAAPAAEASRIPSHDFEGTFVAPVLGDNESKEAPGLAFLTGALSAEGDTVGLFGAGGTVDAAVFDIERLEAFQTRGECPPTSDPTGFRAFNGVNLTVSDNSTFFYGSETPHTYRAESSFALVAPLSLPESLTEAVDVPLNTSLFIVGPGSVTLEMDERGALPAFLCFPRTNVNVTVWQGTDAVETFSGNEWSFRILGKPRLRFDAESLMLPFTGNASATLRPGDLDVVAERLNLDRFTSEFTRFFANGTKSSPRFDADVNEQIRQASPIFNGVLLGGPPGNATIAGKEQPLGKLTLYRFETLELSPAAEGGQIDYAGAGVFVLAGSQLYSAKAATGPKSWPLPVLSLVLWVLAAAAIALGFVLKPLADAGPANASRPVRLTALVFHLVMIPIAFILWDIETRAFLGTSLLTLLGGGSGEGFAFTAVAGIQGVTFTLAWLYFGLPVRYLVNTGLKLMQMKRARGLGKGLSYVTAWGIGAPYYALLLNPIVGLLVDSLGGAF